MNTLLFIIGAVIGLCGVIFLWSCLMAWPVMVLWNWVGVTVLGLNQITFWQALGLLILCGILFKGNSSCNCKKKD